MYNWGEVNRYPLLVVGPWFAPMMLNEPGIGCQVDGELYEVDDKTLKTCIGLNR